MRWIEEGLRQLFLSRGQKIIEALLCDPALPVPADEPLSGERVLRNQRRTIGTLFGEVTLKRRGYYHPKRGSVRYPMDEALRLLQGRTPKLAELMARAASRGSFAVASEDVTAYTGLQIDAREFQRLIERIGPVVRTVLEGLAEPGTHPIPRLYVSADGTGIPLRKDELAGRKGRQPDGSAKTHEVKIGCVFTQHPRPGEDPVRDWQSTSYVATTQRAAEFSEMLLAEARRRRVGAAQEVVFISDAGAWLKETQRICFPQALWILDFYHAAQHVHALTQALDGPDTPQTKRRFRRWIKWLLKDKIEALIHEAETASGVSCPEDRQKELAYLRDNRHGMRYGTFRQKGYFIGSGVIEAGCKTVIGLRLKQSGMFWSTPGAENILALRSALYSQRFPHIWQQDLAALLRAA